MISLIWAMDKNRLIGRCNSLPWRIPADLAYFKKITSGRTVIMGRKTFASMGRPLPNRQNIVITRNSDFQAPGCIVCPSVEEALRHVSDEEAFIIGGAEVYFRFLPYAERLYVTCIEGEYEGDTWFPEIDLGKWTLVSKARGEKNEKNPYDYYFLVYEAVK